MTRSRSSCFITLSCLGIAILTILFFTTIPLSEALWSKRLGMYGNIHTDGSHGCSPKFWQNEDHIQYWALSYPLDLKFRIVFERDLPGDPTLLLVIRSQETGMDALALQATISLLNAEEESIEYPFSRMELISMFQVAFDSADPTKIDALTKHLRSINSGYCTVTQDGEFVIEDKELLYGSFVSPTHAATDAAISIAEPTPTATPWDTSTSTLEPIESIMPTATPSIASTFTSTTLTTPSLINTQTSTTSFKPTNLPNPIKTSLP